MSIEKPSSSMDSGESAAEYEIVPYEVTCTGEVNDVAIDIEGTGSIIEETGVLTSEYELHSLPEEMDPRILNAFLITGYAATSHPVDDVSNPFQYEIPRNTKYTRKLRFDDGHELYFTANCHRYEDRAVSEYTLHGTTGDHDLEAPDPLVEIWAPTDEGELHGNFTISWPTSDGGRLIGQTTTRYSLGHPVEVPSTLHRYVTIDTGFVDGSDLFYQDQQVSLFENFPNHHTFPEHPSVEQAESTLRETSDRIVEHASTVTDLC